MPVDKTNQLILNKIKQWRKDAELFVKEVFKPKIITKQQSKAFREITKLVQSRLAVHKGTATQEQEEYAKKFGLSIQSGKGTGKDAFAAMVLWWFLFCFHSPKVICTAPTGHQLKDVLWAEISKWCRQADSVVEQGHSILTELFEIQRTQVFYKKFKGKEWFAVARTSSTKGTPEDQAETLQGKHEDYLLAIIDEASGVPAPVFSSLETTLTGKCNLALCIYNPTKNTGPAIETQRRDRDQWICLQWNSEESEIVSKEHIDRLAKKYGKDSNYYRVNVLGEPPKAEEDAVIAWDLIMRAVDRYEDYFIDPSAKDFAGVDIGGGGDETVYITRTGGYVHADVKTNKDTDLMKVTGFIGGLMKANEPDYTCVDIVGIGRGVYDRLCELGYPNVMGVNSANTAFDSNRFHNLRAELWWRLREEFERGTIAIPNDEELIGELASPKYEYDTQGRIKIEGKKEMKRRGVASPNKADALVMSFYMKDALIDMDDEKDYAYRARNMENEDLGWMGV